MDFILEREIYTGNSLAPLKVITIPPTTNQPPTSIIVGLHGWGSNAQDLAFLTRFLNLPNCQFMFPEGLLPHPNAAGGWMWYDFGAGYQGLDHSRQVLTDWLKSLPTSTGVPLSRTVLAGFSQGAAMTLDVGLSLALAGLVGLSGYLHPPAISPGQAIPPILLVHGRQDQVVPLRAAQEARDRLTALGARVDYHEIDMGHEIKPAVLVLMRNFVQTAFGLPPG